MREQASDCMVTNSFPSMFSSTDSFPLIFESSPNLKRQMSYGQFVVWESSGGHSDCPSLLCLYLVSAPATLYPFCWRGSQFFSSPAALQDQIQAAWVGYANHCATEIPNWDRSEAFEKLHHLYLECVQPAQWQEQWTSWSMLMLNVSIY